MTIDSVKRMRSLKFSMQIIAIALCFTTITLAMASPSPALAPAQLDADKFMRTGNVVEIGLSPGYLKAARHFLNSINPKADPCEDFFEFACGRWVMENEIPKDLSSYGHFAELREKVSAEMKRLYESKEKSTSRAINNIRQIYQGCMDVERMAKLRGSELVNAIEQMGYWPIVHGDLWRAEKFDLTELLIFIGISRSMDVFVDVYVSPDQKNVSRRMIHIDQGSLGLGASARDYYLNVTRYAKQVTAYKKYMIQKVLLVSEDAGLPKTVEQVIHEVNEIIEFEKAIAKIMISEDERRNYTKLYNVHKLSELRHLLPLIDWGKYFRALMPYDLHSYLNADPDIIVNEVDFLKRLTVLLKATDSRIITNYIIWRYTSAWSFQLDERYDDAQQDFLRMLIGKQTKSPRWKDCSSAVSGRMSYAASALYVRAHFNKADKEAALEMIGDLHAAFREMVQKNDWMDNKTKQIAIEKSKTMRSLIGYPDFIESDQELDNYYKLLKLEPGETYASMVQKTSRWAQERSFRRLIEPVDKSEFGISSSTVNAFYSSLKNGITFPAAVLQAPLFDRSFPKAVNYGGIGSVIGHEITHGFDDQGSQFDKDGNLFDWWDNVTQERFVKRTKCIVEQYSQFSVPGTGLHINGRLTLGENIADNGGIKEAYKAYKRYVEKLGHPEKRLPGLEQYTNDQIFFMSYAQTWCGHSKPEAMIRQVLTDPHAPLRFRVNGVVVNQPEFAQAFHCPVGSPMNSKKRCVVW